MQLLDLPLELFRIILYHSIAVRGMARGVRLRLVNRLFAAEVVETIHTFKMLDQPLASSTTLDKAKPMPHFAASYLKYRVLGEPENGNGVLICIRKVSERLRENMRSSSQEHAHILGLLCGWAVEGQGTLRRIFRTPPHPINEVLSDHVVAAAIRVGNVHITRNWLAEVGRGASGPYSWIFGHSTNLVLRYGTQEIVELFLKGRHIDRCSAFIQAARDGREDLVRSLFNFEIAEFPWRFADPSSNESRSQPLKKALHTPSIAIWNYVLGLRKVHGPQKPVSCRFSTRLLIRCASHGCAVMARHQLHLGADANGNTNTPFLSERPIIDACTRGYPEIVQALLEYNADDDGAMAAAAASGHLAIVKILLDNGCDTTDALVKAVAGGYRDIVELLLDNGVVVKNGDHLQLAIYRVFELEHTALLHLLNERGLGS
ncbi:ankyrin [Lentithecium fluviatile CBS 122367]|uniref:Ankyrin n=1 Tax=Lentithecium fluviatile CBS 122367 TaxID=1168545 RepID=A0A6G1IVE3_9PLEO|nr:ankyrin [Lentithecium fluviatile CBS 122367]